MHPQRCPASVQRNLKWIPIHLVGESSRCRSTWNRNRSPSSSFGHINTFGFSVITKPDHDHSEHFRGNRRTENLPKIGFFGENDLVWKHWNENCWPTSTEKRSDFRFNTFFGLPQTNNPIQKWVTEANGRLEPRKLTCFFRGCILMLKSFYSPVFTSL